MQFTTMRTVSSISENVTTPTSGSAKRDPETLYPPSDNQSKENRYAILALSAS